MTISTVLVAILGSAILLRHDRSAGDPLVLYVFVDNDLGRSAFRDVERTFARFRLHERYGLTLDFQPFALNRPDLTESMVAQTLARKPKFVIAPSHEVAAAFASAVSRANSSFALIVGSRRPVGELGLLGVHGEVLRGVTGALYMDDADDIRRAQLLREWLPNIESVGLLVDRNYTPPRRDALKSSVNKVLGVTMYMVEANTSDEVAQTFALWRSKGVTAAIIPDNDRAYIHARAVQAAAMATKMRLVTADVEFCYASPAVCYTSTSTDIEASWFNAIVQSLNGRFAETIPFVRPNVPFLSINVAALQSIDANIPAAILGRANAAYGLIDVDRLPKPP